MILYLSFAPIEFKGGAERWLKGISQNTAKFDDTYLITVSSEVSDLYGQLVLNRKFSDHTQETKIKNVHYISLTYAHFNPLSPEHKAIREVFQKARIIYAKFELAEMLISIYFGGLSILKKIVGGIHSPLYYTLPQSFMNRLHNMIYTSPIYTFFLKRVKMVHVLNKRDQNFLSTRYNYNKVKQVYDGVEIPKERAIKTITKDPGKLNIITVGELSSRKGTDILCRIIENAPNNFFFTVIGDGPLRYLIESLDNPNLNYLGYIDDETRLRSIYANHDVLLFPSRAETLGLVMPEAMDYGLKVINSKEIALEMPEYIEASSTTEDHSEYIRLLEKVLKDKNSNKILKDRIHKYAYQNFSNEVLHPKFFREILDMNVKSE